MSVVWFLKLLHTDTIFHHGMGSCHNGKKELQRRKTQKGYKGNILCWSVCSSGSVLVKNSNHRSEHVKVV